MSAVNQQTGFYAFLGLSNFILAQTGRDYFAPTTEFNPYTHTWSLAVEEQFYLVFPLLYLACLGGRNGRWRSSALFAIGLVASVAYSAWQSQASPTQAFFLSPGRFWELASGVLLYQLISREPQSPSVKMQALLWRGALAFVSLLALLASFWVSRPENFPMPGALLAVLGTLGVIYSLHTTPELRKMHGLLGFGWLVSVGRISYSLYLWHWPVFVFFRWTYGLDTPVLRLSAVMIAFMLASLSYRFVETPIRQSGGMRKLSQSVVIIGGLAVIGVSCWVTVGIDKASPHISLSQVSKHSDLWYPDGVQLDANYPGCIADPDFYSVSGGVMLGYRPRGCATPRPLNDSSIFVVGDSHALAYSSMFKQYAIRHATQVNAYNNGGCPFISLQPNRDLDNSDCRANTDAALVDLRKRIKPGDVLFLPSLRLPRLADQWVYFGEDAARSQMFGPQADADRKRAEDYAVTVLKEFADKGVRIVFEAPKPLFKAPPFRCADWFNKDNLICKPGFEMSRKTLEEFRAPVLQGYANIASRLPGVEVWDPFPTLCPSETCSAFDGAEPLFMDGDHLSGHGNMKLLPEFTAFMKGRVGYYPATLEQGFALDKSGIPDFLTRVNGFSHVESWGRWTDANLSTASLKFARPLPQAFVLEINAHAYGPNVGAPVNVIAGGVTRQVVFTDKQITAQVQFDGVQGSAIDIVPLHPTSPSSLGASSDQRKLGLGISSIKVRPLEVAQQAREKSH
ncbi:TPA: acyltransferase family protein [Yersinia enterocolitica]|nr:acyltransferase family protein [Yersinia enterocolitica]HEN3294854.1 acyltransferase family protein [Yersinia enterocolitica]